MVTLAVLLGAASLATFVAGLVLQGCSTGYYGSFLSNLSAGLVGSLVTVFLIDRLLKARERQEQAPADSRILDYVKWFCHRTLAVCREGVGFGPESLRWDRAYSKDALRQEELRFSKERVLPVLESQLRNRSEDEIRHFAAKMPGIVAQADRLLLVFERRLSPGIFAILLDIAEAAEDLAMGRAAVSALLRNQPDKHLEAVHQVMIDRTKKLLGSAHVLAALVWQDSSRRSELSGR